MSFTLEQISKLPKIANFRYDVVIKNIDGEDEDLLQALSCKIVETGNSITISFIIPEKVSNSWMASMVASLPSLAVIIVKHYTEKGENSYSTMHRLIDFLGWKTVTHANGSNLLEFEVSYSSEVSFPIAQSEEGLKEWLKSLKEAK